MTIKKTVNRKCKCFFLGFFFISSSVMGQVSGIVKDSLTGRAIPYVSIWVENENIGTTSETNGNFLLAISEEKKIVFSALGYETKVISSKELSSVLLKSVIYQLDEVTVGNKKGQKTIKVGNYKKGKINLFYGSNSLPTILAKKVESTEEIKKYPYIKDLTFVSLCQITEAQVKFRILSIDADGRPSYDLLDEQLIITVKNGKRDNKIDLEKYSIRIPDDGLFVAFEILIIDTNKHEFNFTFQDGEITTSRNAIIYDPQIGTVPSDSQTSWIYTAGSWFSRGIHENSKLKSYENKFGELAVSLTLTN